MIRENLQTLRKIKKYSQEEVAEKIGVSRQAVAKWESGESVPDLSNSLALAKLYEVTLDDLVNYDEKREPLGIPPRGKYSFGMVTMGEKGQIVIPANARKLFGIQPGDSLLLLGDTERGIALLPQSFFMDILRDSGKIPFGEEK